MSKVKCAKDLIVGDNITLNKTDYRVRYVDVGPKFVYLKTLSGKTFSIPINDGVKVF
ncbi:MAG: hypothetical protein R3230_00405 [Nitrosopumilaceae archaeon]|nr:hypothetical protein [Nitrosopumilaceae archaeon]